MPSLLQQAGYRTAADGRYFPWRNNYGIPLDGRADPDTAHIPIVMVTTRGEQANIETAFRNGANDYVTKPINGLELLTKLEYILGENAA